MTVFDIIVLVIVGVAAGWGGAYLITLRVGWPTIVADRSPDALARRAAMIAHVIAGSRCGRR